MANFNTMSAADIAAASGPTAWLRADPRQWPPGTLDRDQLYAAARHLAEHPAHPRAARSLASEVLLFLDECAVAKRVVHDTPIYILLVFCMYLHHQRDASDPASGVTLKAVRTLYAARGQDKSFAGDSHIRDMLAWCRHRGLLQYAPRQGTAGDKRVRPLEPTPLLVDMFQQWVRAFLRGNAEVLAPPLPPEQLPPPEVVYEVLSYRIRCYARENFTPTERFPLIQEFMLHKHGYHVFLSLVAAMRPEGPGASAPVSVSGLARHFDVARGTVRNALEPAHAQGLLELHGEDGAVRLTPAFVQLALQWMAFEATYMHGLVNAAARPAAPPPAPGAPGAA